MTTVHHGDSLHDHDTKAFRRRWSPRELGALVILVLAYSAEAPIEAAIYHPIAHLAGLRMIDRGMMLPVPYGALMVFRLAWNGLLWIPTKPPPRSEMMSPPSSEMMSPPR